MPDTKKKEYLRAISGKNRLERIRYAFPIPGAVLTAIVYFCVIAFAIAAEVAAIGLVLSLMEINSIFTRMLPSWASLEYLGASVSAYILFVAIRRLFLK